MANNRIDELLEGANKREFARANGIPEQTLYKICKKPTMQNISIDVFLKIAHGLGMTAEELYTGKPPATSVTKFSEHDQRLIDVYHGATQHEQVMIDAMIDAAARLMDEQAKNKAQSA